MNRTAGRILSGAARGLLVTGAALAVAGTLSPWAHVTLLRHVDVLLPGLLFAGGGICLAVALLVLLGGRRFPMLCLLGAVVVLWQTQEARRDIPARVKYQLVGAQMAAFPLNRLLDQFHIPNVTVANWSVPDAEILSPGLAWTAWGGGLLLIGGVAGLPSDPALGWALARTVRVHCRACGARWLRSRSARFCPACGTVADPNAPRLCARCGTEAARGDCHCIACGAALSASELPYSPQ